MHLETNFAVLAKSYPRLQSHIDRRPVGHALDWLDPEALRALSAAMLSVNFGLEHWNVPPDRLCPPVPVRFEYLCWVNYLLASNRDDTMIRQPVRCLDIGTGASCIYPLVGAKAFG